MRAWTLYLRRIGKLADIRKEGELGLTLHSSAAIFLSSWAPD